MKKPNRKAKLPGIGSVTLVIAFVVFVQGEARMTGETYLLKEGTEVALKFTRRGPYAPHV